MFLRTAQLTFTQALTQKCSFLGEQRDSQHQTVLSRSRLGPDGLSLPEADVGLTRFLCVDDVACEVAAVIAASIIDAGKIAGKLSPPASMNSQNVSCNQVNL